MVLLKMMSGEDLADSDTCKSYSLVEVERMSYINFTRDSKGNPVIEVHDGSEGGPTSYEPQGNTYVMSEGGKTISSFAHMAPKQSVAARLAQ